MAWRSEAGRVFHRCSWGDSKDRCESKEEGCRSNYLSIYIWTFELDVLTGYTIMHPSFTRPIKTSLQPMHTDIWHFENVPGFEDVRSNMLRLVYCLTTGLLSHLLKLHFNFFYQIHNLLLQDRKNGIVLDFCNHQLGWH